MRRLHLIIGWIGVVAFLLSGQFMAHHHPRVSNMAPEWRLMYISRHIYLLGAVLLNLVLGLYFQERQDSWRIALQRLGSALIVLSPILLAAAFLSEPQLGNPGRGWPSRLGIFALFGGVMVHAIANVGSRAAPEARE